MEKDVDLKLGGSALDVLDLLGVAFIVLKLCNVISWSWVWVIAPFWIPLAVDLVVLGVLFIVDKL